jgi:hypothetical protein
MCFTKSARLQPAESAHIKAILQIKMIRFLKGRPDVEYLESPCHGCTPDVPQTRADAMCCAVLPVQEEERGARDASDHQP